MYEKGIEELLRRYRAATGFSQQHLAELARSAIETGFARLGVTEPPFLALAFIHENEDIPSAKLTDTVMSRRGATITASVRTRKGRD